MDRLIPWKEWCALVEPYYSSGRSGRPPRGVEDATMLCKFRKMLTEQGVTEQLFESIKALLEENGQIMHGGSIVDATIIEAPSSTKNAETGAILRCIR